MKVLGYALRWPGLRPLLVRLVRKIDEHIEAGQPPRPSREHDFRAPSWGWGFSLWPDPWSALRDEHTDTRPKFVGHGYGLAIGDTVLIQMNSGRTGRWTIDDLEYCVDPSDMFWARATFKEYADG